MSEVRLTVGERSYTVGCAAGQEQRIEYLGGLVDAKLKAMGGNLTSSEAKNLLFAALMLADEADEARNKGGPAAPSPAPAGSPFDSDAVAGKLERLATAFENAASALERRSQAS